MLKPSIGYSIAMIGPIFSRVGLGSTYPGKPKQSHSLWVPNKSGHCKPKSHRTQYPPKQNQANITQKGSQIINFFLKKIEKSFMATLSTTLYC